MTILLQASLVCGLIAIGLQITGTLLRSTGLTGMAKAFLGLQFIFLAWSVVG
jgi:hypothetical protein